MKLTSIEGASTGLILTLDSRSGALNGIKYGALSLMQHLHTDRQDAVLATQDFLSYETMLSFIIKYANPLLIA